MSLKNPLTLFKRLIFPSITAMNLFNTNYAYNISPNRRGFFPSTMVLPVIGEIDVNKLHVSSCLTANSIACLLLYFNK